MAKFKREISGYDMSINYHKLWKLIHAGYRIPAWIIYSREYKEPIYDIVEVKMDMTGKRNMIGVRGIGYESFNETFEAFEKNCKSLELQFIDIKFRPFNRRAIIII